jgi:hypothetical protein
MHAYVIAFVIHAMQKNRSKSLRARISLVTKVKTASSASAVVVVVINTPKKGQEKDRCLETGLLAAFGLRHARGSSNICLRRWELGGCMTATNGRIKAKRIYYVIGVFDTTTHVCHTYYCREEKELQIQYQ